MKTNCNPKAITQEFSLRSMIAAFATIALGGALAGALTACGGSSTSMNPNPTPTPAAKTVVQVNIGDAPADWMLAFSMNMSSMSLTGANGNVSVVSSSLPMELMHLMGTMQPLAMISAPQGSYTGASVTIASATVMYMDPVTKVPTQKTIAGPMTATINFSSPITVGSTPMAIGFDLDLASSVTVDAGGNLTMNPVFHVSSGMQGSGNSLDPMNGGIQHMMGAVSSMSGSSFSMTSMQAAQTFTFATNSATTFGNITMMSMMTNGMLVVVDASLQADGSLMATDVRSMMNSGGAMGGGMITAVTGQPATQLTMVMQNGAGAGMMSSVLASGATVTMDGSTVYQIDQDGMDMSNLPFAPVFDASHVYAGQSVMPVSASGMGMGGGMMGGGSMGGNMTSSGVTLEPQGLSGTVAGAITSGSRASFTMALPSDSAFTILNGATSVTVYQQPGTTISGSSIASGATVHASGLLFKDSGQWKMVASRIGAN
jgi:hypothetical protein